MARNKFKDMDYDDYSDYKVDEQLRKKKTTRKDLVRNSPRYKEKLQTWESEED